MKKIIKPLIILVILLAIPFGFDYSGRSIEIHEGPRVPFDPGHTLAINDQTILPCTINQTGTISLDGQKVYTLKNFQAGTLGRKGLTLQHIFVFRLSDEQFKKITKDGYATVKYSNGISHKVSLAKIRPFPTGK